MSKSRKKYPIFWACSETSKKDKQINNRMFRRISKSKLKFYMKRIDNLQPCILNGCSRKLLMKVSAIEDSDSGLWRILPASLKEMSWGDQWNWTCDGKMSWFSVDKRNYRKVDWYLAVFRK